MYEGRRVLICAWALAVVASGVLSSLVPGGISRAQTPSSKGLTFAFWNVQYGTGVRAAGVPCSVTDDAEYGTQGSRNAWGTGHIQTYLTDYIRNDPQVVAFGVSEINPAFAMKPSAVLAHVGWAAKTEIADTALFARHGFAATDWKRLTQCGLHGMYALYGQVWTDSARTDWVHVVNTHLMHPHLGTCGSGVQVDDLLQWIASKATDGKPVVLMGDFNVAVENTDPLIHFPDHITRITAGGYADAWRTTYPDVVTHPGATATWHGTSFNPLPSTDIRDWALWKRIDYIFARNATVTAARLFNHDIGTPRNCAASDHAGIMATIGGVSSGPALPSPWTNRDVGHVGVPGYATGGGEAIAVSGAGADIWGTSDAFHFVHQPLAGDGSIVARVTGVAAAHAWTKAGVMLRATVAADAAHALMLVSSSHGLSFQRRTATGASSSHTNAGAGTAPVWVKLVRSGTRVTAFRSDDGATWIEVGSDTVALGHTVHAGLAVTSHDSAVLARATFDHVQVSSVPMDPGGGTTSPPPPATLPNTWGHGDVGVPALPGTSSIDGDRVVARGSGSDIWGHTDAFHFVHRRMTGNGTVIARLSSVDAVNVWTKAGVMIRDTLDTWSAHASMVATPARGLAFQRRTLAGAASTHTDGGPGGAPVWLRLVRSGSTVTASRSADGVTWTEVGRDTVSMAASVYVGVAVTSHDDGALATAIFDSVRIVEQEVPAGWTSVDVGAVATAGAAVFAGSTAMLSGSGADIWGTADAFHYGYQTVSGDFDATVRVARLDAVHEWTKAGVMVRATTSPVSVHVSVFATPASAKGVAFQRRPIAGGASIHTSGPAVAPPVWLRLSRRGGTITASYRESATSAWIVIGEEWMPDLPPTVLVGLALTSHRDGMSATASFDNVQIAPAP